VRQACASHTRFAVLLFTFQDARTECLSTLQAAAVPADTSKYGGTVAPQKEYYLAFISSNSE
jgi:hypothetical protein